MEYQILIIFLIQQIDTFFLAQQTDIFYVNHSLLIASIQFSSKYSKEKLINIY